MSTPAARMSAHNSVEAAESVSTCRGGAHQPATRRAGRSVFESHGNQLLCFPAPAKEPNRPPRAAASSRIRSIRSLPARRGHNWPVSCSALATSGAPSSRVSHSTAGIPRVPSQRLPVPKWFTWSRFADSTPKGTAASLAARSMMAASAFSRLIRSTLTPPSVTVLFSGPSPADIPRGVTNPAIPSLWDAAGQAPRCRLHFSAP